MKPAPFDYYAPTSVDEALALLSEHGYDAKLLAGGQSLVPTMNFRLSQPAVLVDLNRIQELKFLRQDHDGTLRLGAMTRQSTVETESLVARHCPLLHETMPHIAHRQIRNRGTVGGSLAHADPAAELPAVACALNARFRIRSADGTDRWIHARDFYIALFTTELQPDDLLIEILIPPRPAGNGGAFDEVARRHGDYAMVGVAADVTTDNTGRCTDATLVFLSVGDGPVIARQANALLRGERVSPALISEAAALAARADIEPTADIHASSAYRRHLAGVMAKRVLTRAFQRSAADHADA